MTRSYFFARKEELFLLKTLSKCLDNYVAKMILLTYFNRILFQRQAYE